MNSDISKMVAIPADMETSIGNNLTEENEILNNSIVKKTRTQRRGFANTLEKIRRIMKIFLKLAKINGYDLVGRVRNKNGSFINDSDLLALINDAMSHGKLLLGQSEFINLLYEANVEPDLIINENIKAKLLNLYSGSKIAHDSEAQVESSGSSNNKIIGKSNEIGDTSAERPEESQRIQRPLKRKRLNPKLVTTDKEADDLPSKKRKIWERLDQDAEAEESENYSDNEHDSNQIEWEMNPNK